MPGLFLVNMTDKFKIGKLYKAKYNAPYGKRTFFESDFDKPLRTYREEELVLVLLKHKLVSSHTINYGMTNTTNSLWHLTILVNDACGEVRLWSGDWQEL